MIDTRKCKYCSNRVVASTQLCPECNGADPYPLFEWRTVLQSAIGVSVIAGLALLAYLNAN
jgi:hypothetical protein